MGESEQDRPSTQDPSSDVLLQVSNAMVRLHKEQFGRGPSSARSEWAGPDAVVCFLEGTLVQAERNLLELGEHHRLRDTRTIFQYTAVREFCEPVEKITGRTVRGFISGIDTEADGLVTELFVLFPEGQDGPSRIRAAE